MAQALKVSRRRRATTIRPAGSIREVCLIGVGAGAARVRPGDAVAVAGRSYRVAARDGGSYLHVRRDDASTR